MDSNPYSLSGVPAASAAASERAAFLQRTYMLLLAGIFTFAGTIWAAATIPAVGNLAIGLWSTSPWLVMVLIFGLGYGVRAVAQTHPINLIAYFGYAAFFGLLLTPLVLVAAGAKPDVLTQAALVTVLVFSGLTAYVFTTRKDFSFLGGALAVGFFAMLGIMVCGWLFGFSVGLAFSALGVVLYSGFILYDTSRILHHYPTTAHVPAAIQLFISLIMLFQHVLILLMSLSDD